MKLILPCPLSALSILSVQLRSFGIEVKFDDSHSGRVSCAAGRLRFVHDGELLAIEIVEDAWHFSKAMLVGGFRQLVEEAVEQL